MINLKLKANFSWSGDPFVLKLTDRPEDYDPDGNIGLVEVDDSRQLIISCAFGKIEAQLPQQDEFTGDILLCFPKGGRIERIFRANSRYNSILITERCDQYCLMCSQPPRNTKDEWRFPLYTDAIGHLPDNSTICLSGGEPTLYKESLLSMLEALARSRPDLHIHILSNGQHLVESDVARLRDIHRKIDVLWGIPLYSADSKLHDEIVAKPGAFNTLLPNLYLLAASGAAIELRTVVMSLNVLELTGLASFISDHLDFVTYWAIMAMEPIGFAKANLERLSFDHSIVPQPIHKAIDLAAARGITVKLFNFPLCTVGDRYRKYCQKSISDWKRKYLDVCTKCSAKSDCCGFFEWYNERCEWEQIRAI